jgi:hypothetical protein
MLSGSERQHRAYVLYDSSHIQNYRIRSTSTQPNNPTQQNAEERRGVAGTLVALRRHWLCSSRIFITIAPYFASACKRGHWVEEIRRDRSCGGLGERGYEGLSLVEWSGDWS